MSPRLAVLLAVLLGLQDVGPAVFANAAFSRSTSTYHTKMDKVDDEVDSEDTEDNNINDLPALVPQPQISQSSSKRGWITSIFNIVKTGGKVLSFTTSLAGLGNAVYRAIAGCCGDFPDACKYRDEFDVLKTRIKEKSDRADNLQLQAQNLQVWTNYSINKFEEILKELNEIADEQEEFLQTVSPELTITLNNQTKRIKDFIKKKNESAEAVEYMQVASMYESAIDSALNIGMPLVGLLIPAGAKVYKYAKQKMTARKTAAAGAASDVSLELPPKSSQTYKRSKLGQFLATSKARINNRLASIKTHLNTKYGRAVKIAKGIKSGFGVAMSYANAGLNIWMIIASRESCRQIGDDAKQARDELKKAMGTFDEAIVNITAAKDIMETSFTYLRGNLTAESLTAVLENIKTMVEEVSGRTEEMAQVAVDIQSFLTRINEETTYQQTYDLEDMLMKALFKIPFTLSCYTNKVKMINYVVDLCKKGRASFDALYDEALSLFDSDDPTNFENPTNCERKIGFRYIDKEELRKGWQNAAKEQKFNENCVMNDPAKKATACSYKNQGYDATYIQGKMDLSQAEVLSLIEDCPIELSPAIKKSICNLRKASLDNATISSALGVDLELVEKVTC